jgi:hypothetical protein
VRYYVEEPRSLVVVNVNVNGKTKWSMNLIVDANGPIIKVQQVHHLEIAT